MPPFSSDLRVLVGRFCQLNCFQEALLPVLEHEHGCNPRWFEILRMITWSEISAALVQGCSPGSFGGLHAEAMSGIYSIEWREARPEATTRELIEHLAEGGVPICKVDRFHVSADRRWHGRAHRPHTILVVAADATGIGYSDADHPHTPARISWSELDKAIIRDKDGELAFAGAVASCQDLDQPGLTRLEADFLEKLDTVLLTQPEQIEWILDVLTTRLAALEPQAPDAEIAGIDVVAFINAMAKSMLAAAALTSRRGLPNPVSEVLQRLGRGLDLCVTRALSYAETNRARHLERFRDSTAAVVAAWDSDGSRRVREAVAMSI